jgi:hypothetical protein
MLVRPSRQPLKLIEFAQAIVILGFSFTIPILIFPTIVVLLIVFLDRLGLTLLGKVIVLMVLAGIVKLTLMGVIRFNGG